MTQMDGATFIVRRFVMQELRLRGTGHSLTVEVGDAYYQMASYTGNQLLVEVSSNQFLPDGAGLNAADQKALANLGFAAPDETRPNWTIRMDDPTTKQLIDAGIALAAALLRIFQVDESVVHAALLDEYLRSHQDFNLDPRWIETLGGRVTLA